MCLLYIRANKPHINNKVAYLAGWCSCLALLAGVHILTAALLPGVSWPQTPSPSVQSHNIMGSKWSGHMSS